LIHLGFEAGADAARVDRTATDALLAAAREAKAPRTVVYTSGIWVLGATGARPADETTPVNPAPLVAWRPAHERLVLDALDARIVTAVVRPGIVFGGKGGLLDGFFESAR